MKSSGFSLIFNAFSAPSAIVVVPRTATSVRIRVPLSVGESSWWITSTLATAVGGAGSRIVTRPPRIRPRSAVDSQKRRFRRIATTSR